MYDWIQRLGGAALGLALVASLGMAGCDSLDDDDDNGGGATEVSDTYPYLTAQPEMTPATAATGEDVTVSLEAVGPNGLFSITATLFTPSNEVGNGSATLVQVGDTEQWSGTITVSNPATVSTSYLHISLQETELTEEDNDPIITDYTNGDDTEATKYTFVQRTLNALESDGEGESEYDIVTINIVSGI